MGVQSGSFDVMEVFLEVVIMDSGMLEPFVGPGGKVGVPSQVDDQTVCDNMMEVIRVCAAAVVSVYLYINVQQKHGTFAPDHVAAMFLALALNTFKNDQTVTQIDEQIIHECQNQNEEVKIKCIDLQWLMKWLQAELSGRVAAVYETLGDEVLTNANRNTRQRSLLHLVKALPDCPIGYSLYCKSCLQNDQIQAAYLFAVKGVDVATTQQNRFQEACLSFITVLCLISGAGENKKWDRKQVLSLIEKASKTKTSVDNYLPQEIREKTILYLIQQIINQNVQNVISSCTDDELEPMKLQLDLDNFSVPLGAMIIYD